MAFPDSKITKFVRRVIMVSTFALFFVTAPIVILYTAGYRYNFSNGKLERTGVISIDANPTVAEYFVNGKLVGDKSPLRIPNLPPGSYRVSIRAAGYRSFEKDVIVQSQQTTYIKNIFLYTETLPEKYSSDYANAKAIKISPTGKYLLILTQNSEADKYSLLLVNTDNDVKQILREFSSSEKVHYAWSPYADFIVIESYTNTRINISILTAEDPVSVRTETFPITVEYTWGHSNNSPELIVKNNEQISLLTTVGISEIATTTASAWFVDASGKLWTADHDKILIEQNSDNARAYSLLSEPESIISIDKKRAIIKTTDGITVVKFSSNEPEIRHISNASDLYFNNSTNEWLIWTDSELWSVYEDGSVTILNRTGERIILVRPVDRYGALLIATPKGIFAYNPGYYVTQQLASATNITDVGVDIRSRKLYFLGEVVGENNLYKMSY